MQKGLRLLWLPWTYQFTKEIPGLSVADQKDATADLVNAIKCLRFVSCGILRASPHFHNPLVPVHGYP